MLKQITLALGMALLASQASAHSRGHGTITPEQALESAILGAGWLAANTVDRDWSPLPQSWASLGNSAARILAEVDGDYVVAVTNEEEGKTFYILIAGDGGMIDANFTGTFPYVWDLHSDGTQVQD